VKRRKAIQKIGAGLTAGLAIPAWLTSCKEDDPGPEIKYDGVVAVIGAGAAGLYAADILHSKGIKVNIFEASDRIGGRIRSVKMFDDSPLNTDFPIELGAERIYGSDSLWAKTIGQMNVPLIPIDQTTTNRYFIDGSIKTDTDLATDDDFTAAKNFLNSLSTYSGANVSVAQAAQAGLSSRVLDIVNSWIGNRYGTSNDRLSVTSISQANNRYTPDYSEMILRSNPMQDVLTSRFNKVVSKVELNTQITRVDYSGTMIVIEGKKGTETFTTEADKVIIAVPVSILKSGDITFSPPLPAAKLTALSNMDMDAALRVFIDFKQNFWGADTAFIYGGENAPEYFNTGLGRSQFKKTLSVTIHGPRAQAFSAMSELDVVNTLLSELDAAFDVNVLELVRKDDANNPVYHLMDWSKQPFIEGSASYIKPDGVVDHRTDLAAPIQELLYFAGEATDNTKDAGSVNGALNSGARAAEELIASIT
jgi:monoamine oxidase